MENLKQHSTPDSVPAFEAEGEEGTELGRAVRYAQLGEAIERATEVLQQGA